MNKFLLGCATAALATSAAYAQSTGSVEAEGAIIVTGTRQITPINGIQTPDAPKAKAVLTQEYIERRSPGQSILDTINMIPGVSFTNSDAYGSSGGQIRIRGFDGNRISLTFDGIPLNDSGNYAIYSQQQLDSELIDQVNVNFGSADVDSPTASASGGTVNYRSLTPSDDLGATMAYSHGTYDMNRIFGMIQTGEFTPIGTKAWVSASSEVYDQFRGPGSINKKQYNGKIYQPIGGSGDFLSIAAHYNKSRNSFYSNPNLANLRTVLGATVVPTAITADTPYTVDLNKAQYDSVFNSTLPAFLYDANCQLPARGAGVQNDGTACSNVYSTATNPSNTGNIRLNSRFTLSDKLTLTFDGAYQTVKANGGGSTLLSELDSQSSSTGVYGNQRGRIGAGVATGVDLNHDGDIRDFVRVYFPSNTRTHRFTAITSLRYDINDDNLIRLAYTWDRARHRQTGEASLLGLDGRPADPFSGAGTDADYQVRDAAGNVFQKRNRLSYAILHQVSGEYRGSFIGDALNVALGVRAPFFRRNLSNFCYTIPGSSNDAYCTSQTAAQVAANTTTATYGAPYNERIKKYSVVLPSAGVTFNFTPQASAFASYSKGFSAPRTDNLYAFDDVKIKPANEVKPEKTDSFDLGLRYKSRMIQAQLAGWYIKYNNRIISSLVELEGGGSINIDRNVGKTVTKGVDLSVNVQPIEHISLYGFVSYIDSELKEDAINPVTGAVLAATKGKFVVETPKWQYGGQVRANFEPVSGGVTVKHTGQRYVTDINDVISGAYTVVDLDVRLSLAFAKLEKTYLQLNVSNLLKERYFGNLSTVTNAAGGPRFTFGAPRSFVGSIHFQF